MLLMKLLGEWQLCKPGSSAGATQPLTRDGGVEELHSTE